jgi:hypothetical protein
MESKRRQKRIVILMVGGEWCGVPDQLLQAQKVWQEILSSLTGNGLEWQGYQTGHYSYRKAGKEPSPHQ